MADEQYNLSPKSQILTEEDVMQIVQSQLLNVRQGRFGSLTAIGNTFSTPDSNLQIGTDAGSSLAGGADNVFLGYQAGKAVTTGNANVYVGYQAGFSNTVQGYGVSVGYQAGKNTTGNSNTFFGYQAGLGIVAGGGNIALGYGADFSTNTSYSIVIGSSVQATANNQCVIGHTQGINDYYLGKGVTNATPINVTLHITDASGVDVGGGTLDIRGGGSTGNQEGGSIRLLTSPAGVTGSSANAFAIALTIDANAAFTFAGAGAINFASKSMTNVNIDSGTINGITDLAVADGGTGVSTFGGTNTLLYTSAADTLSSIATTNSGILVTSGAGVPSIATDIPTAVTIGSAYIYRVGGTDVNVANGGTGLSTITALSIWVANSANTITEVTPGAGNSIRINAGGTAWEAYTPTTGLTYKNGTTSRNGDATSGDQTIAHGLGATPSKVKITVLKFFAADIYMESVGVYNGTTYSTVFAGQSQAGSSSTKIVNLEESTGKSQVATVALDSTNITLTWTKAGAPSADVMYILWEVE